MRFQEPTKSRKELKSEFLKSLNDDLNKKGFTSTGSDSVDHMLHMMNHDGIAVGDAVIRTDDSRQGTVVELHGKLASIRSSNGVGFKALTYNLRKL